MKLFFFLLSVAFFFFAYGAASSGDASVYFLFPFGFSSLILSLLIKKKNFDDSTRAEPTEQYTQFPEIPPARSKEEVEMLELGTGQRFSSPINSSGQADSDDDYIAFDLETTGLSPLLDHIIEIGAVKVRNGEIVDEFSQLVDPGCPIPAHITQINHITDDMVAGQPSIQTVLSSFLSFIGSLTCVAHNASFDRSFLYAAANACGLEIHNAFADSLKLARQMFPSLPNKKLATVCEAIGYPIGQAHRALDDAKAVHAIIQACAARSDTMEEGKRTQEKHFQLVRDIEAAYTAARKSDDFSQDRVDAILAMCREDFDLVQPIRAYYQICGYSNPRFDSFRRAILLLVKRKEYDEAIAICRRAVELEIPDSIEGGMAGRLEKLIRQKETALAKRLKEETSRSSADGSTETA